MAKISVKHYTNTMASAPQLNNEWGELTGLLDAVLVNGFGFKTIDSITRVGNIATATVSTGHPYEVGQAVAIEGCNQAAYNGEIRVLSISTNTFDYEVQGEPTSPATTASAISAKVAPLGFEIAFSATTKRAYRSKTAANKHILLINDGIKTPSYTTSWAKWANVGVVESMSDINTITGAQAPYLSSAPNRNWVQTQANQWGYHKWYWAVVENASEQSSAPAGTKQWLLVGDDKFFYLFINPHANQAPNRRRMYMFGEIPSYKVGDTANTVLVADARLMSNSTQGDSLGATPSSDAGFGLAHSGNVFGHVLLKDSSGYQISPRWSSWHLAGISGYSANMPTPNPADYSIWLQPIYCREETSAVRGIMPGVYCLPQAIAASVPDMSVIDNVVGLERRKFLIVHTAAYSGAVVTGAIAFDLTGNWV